MEKRYRVIKPKHGFYKGECLDTDIAPTMHTCGGGNLEPKILVPEAAKKGYDTATYGDSINMAYPNSKTRRGRVGHGVAQTLTTGDSQQVVIEPLALDEQNGYIRQDGCVGTFTTDGSSPKHNNRVVEPILVGGIGEHDFGKQNRQGDRMYSADGVACALNAQPLGNAGGYSYLYQEPSYRIRKLTERECGRLMGVKSEDCEKIAKNQSTSSQYHLYGDSIVTTCLMSIFGELFDCNYQEKINSLVEGLRK